LLRSLLKFSNTLNRGKGRLPERPRARRGASPRRTVETTTRDGDPVGWHISRTLVTRPRLVQDQPVPYRRGGTSGRPVGSMLEVSCARVVARRCRTHAVVSERREYGRLRHRIGVRFQLAHPGWHARSQHGGRM